MFLAWILQGQRSPRKAVGCIFLVPGGLENQEWKTRSQLGWELTPAAKCCVDPLQESSLIWGSDCLMTVTGIRGHPPKSTGLFTTQAGWWGCALTPCIRPVYAAPLTHTDLPLDYSSGDSRGFRQGPATMALTPRVGMPLRDSVGAVLITVIRLRTGKNKTTKQGPRPSQAPF